MTRHNKFLTTAGSFVVALSALAVITAPASVQAEVEDKQSERYQRNYCTTPDACR